MLAILNQFWRDERVSDAEQAIELEGWLDVLDVLTDDEVRRAWADYQRTGPRSRSGTLRRPDAGIIRDMAMRHREFEARAAASRPAALPPPPEPERPKLSDAQRARIMAEVGFDPNRAQLLRRFPRAANYEQALQMQEDFEAASAPADWDVTAPRDDPRVQALQAARAANPLMARAMARAARNVEQET